VESVTPERVSMRLSGAVSLERTKGNFTYRYAPEFSGVLEFDRAKGAFRKFDVLAIGEWTWDYRPGTPKEILGVALELWPHAFASPRYDRHFPGWSMSNYGYKQDRE